MPLIPSTIGNPLSPLLPAARSLLILAAFFAGSSVAAGAFGAHALRDRLSPEMLVIFETGVRYQMYHALALLGVGGLAQLWPQSRLLVLSGRLFVAGILIFTGSLMALSLSGVRVWGAVTPLGGLAFLAGWICLLTAFYKDGVASSTKLEK